MGTLLAHPQNFKKAGRTQGEIRYLVIHYTGNKGDTAKNNVDYYARTALQTSAHYFVDENEIWRSVPDEDIAWHCGRTDGKYVHPECRNGNSIGIEICMWDKSTALRQDSIDRAADLARSLMRRYAIPEERVVRHYDVTGKICPAPMVNDPKLWKSFRASLAITVPTEAAPDDSFERRADARYALCDPIYESLADVPSSLRQEAEVLIACGAIRGTGRGLHLPLSTLRAAIIAARYVNARLDGKEQH